MSNKLGVYGVPEMINIHGSLREQRPAEVTAALHILNPTAPRFVPAPVHPGELWCPGHRDFTPLTNFSPDSSRANGHRGYCKACERRMEKERRAKKAAVKQGRWYRDTSVLVQKSSV